MVEMVRWDALDPGTGHGHGRMGVETGDPKHGNKQRCLVLTHSATVREIHLGIVEGISLTLAHGYSRITHIIGHPVGQKPYFSLLVGDSLKDLGHLLLHLGGRLEAAIILIDSAEPNRLVLPLGSRGQHELGSDVKQIDHVRLPPERPRVGDGETHELAVTIDPHGRMALSLIELVLHLFSPGDIEGVDLRDGGIGHPERHDVVEIALHRRDEPVFLVKGRRGEQGICESLLADSVINDITWLQDTDLDHDLPGTPIDGPCRSGIVADRGKIDVPDSAVGLVNLNVLKDGLGGQRVIVIFQNPVSQSTFRGLDLDDLMNVKRS